LTNTPEGCFNVAEVVLAPQRSPRSWCKIGISSFQLSRAKTCLAASGSAKAQRAHHVRLAQASGQPRKPPNVK